MISNKELNKAIEIAKKYNAGKLYLFGSSLHKDSTKANDYDFAVSDIPPSNFFEFYGKLIMALSKNVDLIDLSGKKSKFKEIVLEEGKLVYDKESS